ncbi:hypothetical protein Efla_006281 [Eimeria flavescens]
MTTAWYALATLFVLSLQHPTCFLNSNAMSMAPPPPQAVHKPADTGLVVGLSTASSSEEARKIAEHLILHKLAACVQVVPAVESFYEWKGRLERSSEVLLIIKTQRDLTQALVKAVKENHSYDVPEVVFTDVVDGNEVSEAPQALLLVFTSCERLAARGLWLHSSSTFSLIDASPNALVSCRPTFSGLGKRLGPEVLERCLAAFSLEVKDWNAEGSQRRSSTSTKCEVMKTQGVRVCLSRPALWRVRASDSLDTKRSVVLGSDLAQFFVMFLYNSTGPVGLALSRHP